MELIIESGKSRLLFVGTGTSYQATDPSRPFTTPAGSSVLRTGATNVGLIPHYIELRASSSYDEDTIAQDDVDKIYSYIKENNITRVITLGKQTSTSLFPSITLKQSMSNLVASPMIKPLELDISVGVMYHPVQVHLSNDSDSITDWWARLDELINKRSDVHITTQRIDSEDEFFSLLDYLTQSNTIQSVDYETNAVDAFHVGHYMTCIGVAEMTSQTSANAWWFITDRVLSSNLCDRLKKYFNECRSKIWVYNCPFEMKVTWHWTGELIRMNDAMVLATLHAERASLKNLVRKSFGALMWEAPVKEFMEKSKSVFQVADKNEEIRNACLHGDLITLRTNNSTKNSIEWMLETYTESEVIESMSHYPHPWGSVPKDLLGNYCALDAGYTTLIVNKYNTPDIRDAYDVYIRHPWLATKFEVNGVYWNDAEAVALTNASHIEMLQRLYDIIKDSAISQEKKIEASTIYGQQLPYTKYWYTEKTKKERSYVVSTVGDKIEELKGLFNPSSNTKDSRAIFWDAYLNDSIQLGSVLLLFINSLELAGQLPALHSAIGDKSFLYSNTPDVVLTKILEIADQKTSLGREVKNCLAKSADGVDEVIGRFASEVVKFQYQVHNQFLGLKIDDVSTWNKSFHMLFNIFMFKKIGKMVSTNVDGTTGRSAVNEIVGLLHGMPLRGKNYWDDGCNRTGPLLMNPEFNSLAAASTRWTSGFHCLHEDTAIRTTDGKSVKIKDLYKSFHQYEVYSVPEGSTEIIRSIIKDVHLSGYSNTMIELTLENGKTIECTPNHRFLTTSGEYIEAKDMTDTTDLLEF